jgi:hypothetical protein
MRCGRRLWSDLVLCLLVVAAHSLAAATHAASCQKIVLTGEVNAGREWRTAFGQGWVFRLVPIEPGKAGYSGWDLVVDREQPAGFPDALLVATPPYNSLNEHEVGTTFGLRAQDAIGWNPRSFRFLTDPEDFRESQKLFQLLGKAKQSPAAGSDAERAMQRQMKIDQRAAAGQLRILDAHLAPGVSDAASYAESWALASPKTPHSFEQASGGKSTPLGELLWMRFSITLWLPPTWAAPRELHAEHAPCAE